MDKISRAKSFFTTFARQIVRDDFFVALLFVRQYVSLCDEIIFVAQILKRSGEDEQMKINKVLMALQGLGLTRLDPSVFSG